MDTIAADNKLDRIANLLEELVQLMGKQGQGHSDTPAPAPESAAAASWLNPAEAAYLLGIPVTKSRTHTRRLAWYRNNGFLTQFQGERPICYFRKDVMALAKRIENGEVIIPPVI